MSIRKTLMLAALFALPGLAAQATVPPATSGPAVLPDTTQPAPPQRRTDIYGPMTKASATSPPARCMIFFLKACRPPAGPQWQDPMAPQMATIMMTVQPAHWNGTWHPDPRPQWIIPLQGRWYVRAMDGTRVEMGPGDILFGEDQAVRPMANGPFAAKGHDAGNIGDGPVTLMVIQSDAAPVTNRPCRYN